MKLILCVRGFSYKYFFYVKFMSLISIFLYIIGNIAGPCGRDITRDRWCERGNFAPPLERQKGRGFWAEANRTEPPSSNGCDSKLKDQATETGRSDFCSYFSCWVHTSVDFGSWSFCLWCRSKGVFYLQIMMVLAKSSTFFSERVPKFGLVEKWDEGSQGTVKRRAYCGELQLILGQ